MYIPKIIRIGSVTYDVITSDETLVVDRHECKGLINYEFHKIKINNSLQDVQGQEQTFLHEVVHGIIKERNLDLENSEEEIIVEEIATGLHQVIKDNPEMFSNNFGITGVTIDGIFCDKYISGLESKGIYPTFDKTVRIPEKQNKDSIKIFKGKNLNELSKKDVQELAEILSIILKREYNPHTQLIIDSESFRITEDVAGAPFNE